jgi:hypothetical protein
VLRVGATKPHLCIRVFSTTEINLTSHTHTHTPRSNHQGIDLSNIVTTAGGGGGEDGGEHPIIAASKGLATAVKDGDRDAAVEQLKALAELVPAEEQGKTMAGNAGAIGSACDALNKIEGDPELALAALEIVLLLIVGNEFNRDKLKEPLADPGIAAVARTLIALPAEAPVQEAGFRLVKTAATKSEAIKASFMEYDGIKPMRECFERHSECPEVIKMVAATMRAVTNADDWSTKMSKVFDTAKDLAKGGLLPLVYDAMRKNGDNPEIQVELMGALKGCSIQDDIVKGIVSDGGLALALKAFKQHMDHPSVAQRSMLLLSNMAENDDVKKILCEGDALPLMLTCMQLHGKVARVVAAGFTAIASMALRMPDNVELMMEAGTARVLIEGMRAHGSVSELNRQAMIAIRNMVVRCPQHRESFLAEGAEELIIKARDTHIKCADAAFDCLRDLGCEYGGLGDMAGKGKHSAYVHVSRRRHPLQPTLICSKLRHDALQFSCQPLFPRVCGFSSRFSALGVDPNNPPPPRAQCEESLLNSKTGQANAGSSMVTWEEED